MVERSAMAPAVVFWWSASVWLAPVLATPPPRFADYFPVGQISPVRTVS